MDNFVAERTIKERFGGDQRRRGVVALVNAVQTQQHVFVGGKRRANAEQSSAHGDIVAQELKLIAHHPERGAQ